MIDSENTSLIPSNIETLFNSKKWEDKKEGMIQIFKMISTDDKIINSIDNIMIIYTYIRKQIKNDEKILEICFGENEKGLCPKQSLLEWLVNNTDKLTHLENYGSTNKTTQENRKKLFNGSETKRNEALNLISLNFEFH